jgi:hypothetical protein
MQSLPPIDHGIALPFACDVRLGYRRGGRSLRTVTGNDATREEIAEHNGWSLAEAVEDALKARMEHFGLLKGRK